MTNNKPKHKNLNPNQTQQNNNTDSSTQVNFRLEGERVTVGFKCNKKLWKSFVSMAEREFGSVCHILEPIILALLTAQVNQSKTIKPIVIENITVERAVKRVRRYGVEREVDVGEGGGRLVDFYDLDAGGVWRRVEVVNDWDVNVNGHLVGCECKVCRGLKHGKEQF